MWVYKSNDKCQHIVWDKFDKNHIYIFKHAILLTWDEFFSTYSLFINNPKYSYIIEMDKSQLSLSEKCNPLPAMLLFFTYFYLLLQR